MLDSREIFGELKAASYFSFDHFPDTTNAQLFCNSIIEEILAVEERKRKRRACDQDKFNKATVAMLCRLLAVNDVDKRRWVFRSLREETFTSSSIKGETFRKVISGLKALDYVQVVKGGNHRNPFHKEGQQEYHAGLATRFSATDKLIDQATSFDVHVGDYRRHFKKRPNLNQVTLKASSQRIQNIKYNGKQMKYAHTDQTNAIKEQLIQINTYLSQQRYSGMEFYGLRRIFNEGDRPDFHWNMGGRLYAASENSFQQLKKKERLKIKINDQGVVEIDINASYLRILHSLRGFEIPDGDDIYKIGGLDRRIVKAWIATTLGHDKFHRAWSKSAIETLHKAGFEKKKLPSYPSIKAEILKRFPVLEGWGTFDIRWSHLMFEESEAVIQAMLALQRNDIPSLPVHDSLIVPKSDADQAQFVLKSILEHRFGVPFALGVTR